MKNSLSVCTCHGYSPAAHFNLYTKNTDLAKIDPDQYIMYYAHAWVNIVGNTFLNTALL